MPETLSRLLAKWRSWRQLSSLERRLFLPTWALLGRARLAIAMVPFRRLVAHLGAPLGSQTRNTLPTPAQAARAEQVGRAVRLAARYTPWDSLCQVQAIVARYWLGLFGIPYVLNYGLRRNQEGELHAHAWVCVGPVFVTGGDGYAAFTVVGSFGGDDANKPPPSDCTG